IVGPKFKPRDWNRLAEDHVWIVYQDEDSEPITIRHQLTTSQSKDPEDNEYSIIKNLDGITKFFRDRLKPYAGKHTITDGYLERLDGSFTTAIEEVKEMGLARNMTILTPWRLRRVPSDASGQDEVKTNLITRVKVDLAYPANNLDVYLLI